MTAASVRPTWTALREEGRRFLAALAVVATTGIALTSCRDGLALRNAQASPVAVASLVVRGLAARDLDGLRALAVTEAEFREIVWPKLPASRPERNVPWDYAWQDLHGKSEVHLRSLLAPWQDRGFAVTEVTFRGQTTDYGTYRVHRETIVTLRDVTGKEQKGRLFGSMIEMDGRFKVFSYVVD